MSLCSDSPVIAFVGIDVSKDTLDCHALPAGEAFQVANTAAGRKGLIDRLQAASPGQPPLVLFEASGGYEAALHRDLWQAGLPPAIANPKRVRDFARASGQLAKTDRLDARIIARFAEVHKPRPVAPRSSERQALGEMMAYRQTIRDEIVARKQQLRRFTAAGLQERARTALARLADDLQAVDAEIKAHIESHPVLAEQDRRLRTCPAVGRVCSASLLAYLPELGRLTSGQIASLAGLAPFACDSGQMRGKRTIYGGRAKVRSALFMPAMVAIKHNPVIKALYERLVARRKPHKVAITAAMRKLLTVLNAMLSTAQDWDENRATT